MTSLVKEAEGIEMLATTFQKNSNGIGKMQLLEFGKQSRASRAKKDEFKRVLAPSEDKDASWFNDKRQGRSLSDAEAAIKSFKTSKDNCTKSMNMKTS